jgi:arginyl-tRNA synthetase
LIREELSRAVSDALAALVASGRLPEADYGIPEISDTRSPEHGDYACNIALTASKKAGMSPRQLGEALVSELDKKPYLDIEIAGPGFLNFRIDPTYVASFVPRILSAGDALARSTPDRVEKINIEYVSVNPNGPITVGSGRGAAFGSCLANVLEAAGHSVHREYYINDGVNSEQMRLFAESVAALVEGRPIPENGYKGDYVAAVAQAITGQGMLDRSYREASQELMIARQREDLADFGVEFDTWFSEQSLHDRGDVQRCLAELENKGVADERPLRIVLKLAKGGKIEDVVIEEQGGEEDDEETLHPPTPSSREREEGESRTLWLRSTKFGDDMDRVLRRRDGRLTYIASDVAYHRDKLTDGSGTRGCGPVDRMITILGPDHHGYIGRLTAVVAALLENPDVATPDEAALDEIEAKIFATPHERDACRLALEEARRRLEVVIFQIVRFMKDGNPAPMRKRDGNIYALIDLVDELGKTMAPEADQTEQRRIGRDVARYFYLMRSHDSHMDFDIDLATSEGEDNPVFYVQYAHARLSGVVEKAKEAGIEVDEKADISLLVHPRESALIKMILDLPFEVRRCAADYGVHRLTTYAHELARAFHHFYDACRVIQPDEPALSKARVTLCEAARIGLRSVLGLLGVSAPARM